MRGSKLNASYMSPVMKASSLLSVDVDACKTSGDPRSSCVISPVSTFHICIRVMDKVEKMLVRTRTHDLDGHQVANHAAVGPKVQNAER